MSGLLGSMGYSTGSTGFAGRPPAGTIKQVKSASYQGYQTVGTTEVDVTSLSTSMTIVSGNKVYIIATIYAGRGQDDYGSINITDGSNSVIYANNTGTGNHVNASMGISNPGNLGGSVHHLDSHSFNYLWSPGVTAITVKARVKCTYGDNVYINGSQNTGNAGYHLRATSTLAIMEIQV